MLKTLSNCKFSFMACFGLVMLTSVISLLQPQVWSRLLGGLTQADEISILILLAISMMLCQVVEVVLDIFQEKIVLLMQQDLVIKLRRNLLESVLKMKIEEYIKLDKGELLSRIICDTEEISNGIIGELIRVIVDVIKMVMISLFLFTTNIYLAIFSYVYQFIMHAWLHRHELKMRKKYGKNSVINDQYISEMEMIIGGVIEINNLDMIDEMNSKIDKILQEKKSIQYDLTMLNMKYQAEVQILNFIYQFFVLSLGIVFINHDIIDFQKFVAFSSYSSILSVAINSLYSLKSSYFNCFNSMDRFFELVEDITESSGQKKEKTKKINNLQLLQLSDFSFGYEDQHMVIDNINATFNKGKINFVIGKSGVGKTTLLMILSKMFRKYNGNIYCQTEGNEKIGIDNIANKVVLIRQNPFFLNCSIYENLHIVNRKKNKKVIENVCQIVGIFDEIMEFPDGFDTVLMNNASNISAGQRQRLAIARVLLLEFDVLLCDEVIANVDPKSRMIIMNVIREIAKKKIVIMVTHQMEVIESGDNTLIME